MLEQPFRAKYILDLIIQIILLQNPFRILLPKKVDPSFKYGIFYSQSKMTTLSFKYK